MATNDNSGWESAPSTGGVIPSSAMTLNDAMIQAEHPNWPNGGTAAQVQMESKNKIGQVSPKGAMGLAQVIPSTLANIEKDVGRKLNPDDPQDALTIHRYVINQNMQRFKDDPDAAVAAYNSGWNPSKWNNPETQNYVKGFKDNSGWETAPSQPSAASQPQAPQQYSSPDAFNSQSAKDEWESAPPGGVWNNIKGAALQGANIAGGFLEAIPIGVHAGIEGIRQGDLGAVAKTGFEDFSKYSPESGLNALGVDTSGLQQTAGYKVPGAVMNFLADTVPGVLGEGLARTGQLEAGMSPSDYTPEQGEKMKHMIQAGMILAPLAEIPHLAGRFRPSGAPGDSAAKILGDDAAAPSAEFVGPPRNTFMGPNEGPMQQFIVNSEGVAARPNQAPSAEMTGAEIGRQRQQAAEQQVAGDLFPSTLKDTEGQASPYNPNLEAGVEPFNIDTMQGQGRLPLDTTDTLREAMKNQTAEQLDMFNPIDQRTFDQFGPDEEPRSLTSEEFADTVTNLAAKDGTRFPLPEDMDAAYSRYLDTVRDDQGGLFDRPTIASKFVEAAKDESRERRVADHPVVRANQARVDRMQAALEAGGGKTTPGGREAMADAQRTLEKSKENIGKALGDDPYGPKAQPDGTVNMYTFGHLPTLMKSIGAVLRGIHGLVFKTLDRLLPDFKNLDTTRQIIGQGIKNFVRKEATRDWAQTVNAKPIAQASRVPGLKGAVTELNPHAQDDLSPEQLKEQFNTAQDLSDSKVGNALRNNLLQGGLMLSDFSRHPLVKYVTDNVAKAFRSSDKWTRENLLNKKTGLGPMMRRMSLQDFTEIRTLMEAHEGVKEFSEGELKGRGYNDKQVEYYKRSLELSKEQFTNYNNTRELIGLPKVDARLAHIAGYFTGDFKQMVRDSSGRLIAVLGHNNRAALGVIAQRFKEMHPQGDTLDMGKPELRRGSGEDNTFHGYMNILAKLGRDNPDIQRLLDVYHEQQMAATNKLSQMSNRAKFKSNPENTVGGAEGSKLWQSMQKNAKDGGAQQLKYLESVNKWSEFANAMNKSQKFIEDPEVNAPNAKAVSQRYLDNQMHRNMGDLAAFTNKMVDGLSEITGVGPTQLRHLSGMTKAGLLNMFVGVGKLPHSLVTFIQPLLGIPTVNSVLKASGAKFGMAQITSAFKAPLDVAKIIESSVRGKTINDPFLREANQYARDNDSFNTSQFNMGSVTKPPSKLGNLLHINVSVPESGSRMFTYMYYARMLKDAAGDTMSNKEIFGAAHNAVQKVMADYNREAQAPVFSKMGFLGDLTRMLTTFKMNQISQYATAGKMLSQGKVMPMITMLATSVAAAGLRGFIGYNIANSALGVLTTWATKQGMMSQPTNLDQMILHMLHGKNQHLADALNFGATSALGIDMTGSLSHADDIPDDPMGTLLPETPEIFKAIGSGIQLAEHPNTQRAKALAYDVTPNAWKGIEENTMFTNDKGQFFDPHTGNLVANRTPLDMAKRAAGGFRPLEESKARLVAETDRNEKTQQGAVRSDIEKRMLSDADSGSLNAAAISKYAQDYTRLLGDPNTLVSKLVQHVGMDKARDILQREQGIPTNMVGGERYKQTEELK